MTIGCTFWTAHMRSLYDGSLSGETWGTVMLCNRKIYGGDNAFYFIGTYNDEGGQFEADVQVVMYRDTPGALLPAGQDYRVELMGRSGDRRMDLKGFLQAAPIWGLWVVMTRVDEVPQPF